MKLHGAGLAQVVPAAASPASGPTASIIFQLPATPQFGVFLGRYSYAAAWTAIHAFHFVCAAYFIAGGLLYRAMPTTKLSGMLRLYSLTVDRKYFHAIGTVHYVLAALHVRFLLTTFIYAAIRAFLSHRHQKKLKSLQRRVTQRRRQLTTRGSRNTKKRHRVLAALLYVYGVVLAPSGLLGVESDHFETLFLARELLETAMQAFQAYKMSILLPRAVLNRFYVAVLIFNCWSTPFLYRFGGKNRALQRLLCLLSDVVLDFISAAGVPIVLTLHYLDSYSSTDTDFPTAVWYNEKWMVQFMGDAPVILGSSWVDTFSRFVFSLGLLATIDDIKILIRQKDKHAIDAWPSPSAAPTHTQHHDTKPSRLVRWTPRVMALFGLAILIVQLHAEAKPPPPFCILQVRPWLVEKPACALIEVNCLHTPTQSGNATDVASIFGNLDAPALELIVMRHCPQVEILSGFQDLSGLIGVKSYNSTITKWEADAALTQSSHPKICFLFFVRTNFSNSALPEGLLSTNFPTRLRDIEISGSNLRSLPDDLHLRWPQRLTLFLEYAQLPSFPLVLSHLSPRMLSLCGNQITWLPPEAFLLPEAYTVAFTGNPLTSLPDSGVDPRQVFTTFWYLDVTAIASLPTWMDETFLQEKSLFLGATPFCVDVLLNESATEEQAQLQATRPSALKTVDCNEPIPEYMSFYPQYLEVRDGEGTSSSSTTTQLTSS